MTAIRILVGSVYGGALLTAREIKKDLEAVGHQVTVLENPSVSDMTGNTDALLVCTSTTGQGEVPANLLPSMRSFAIRCRNSLAGHSASSCSATAHMAIRSAAPES